MFIQSHYSKNVYPFNFALGDFITCLVYVFCVPGCVFQRCPLHLYQSFLFPIFLLGSCIFPIWLLVLFSCLSWPTFVEETLQRIFVMLINSFQHGWETDLSLSIQDGMRWKGHFISRRCLPYFQQNIFFLWLSLFKNVQFLSLNSFIHPDLLLYHRDSPWIFPLKPASACSCSIHVQPCF